MKLDSIVTGVLAATAALAIQPAAGQYVPQQAVQPQASVNQPGYGFVPGYAQQPARGQQPAYTPYPSYAQPQPGPAAYANQPYQASQGNSPQAPGAAVAGVPNFVAMQQAHMASNGGGYVPGGQFGRLAQAPELGSSSAALPAPTEAINTPAVAGQTMAAPSQPTMAQPAMGAPASSALPAMTSHASSHSADCGCQPQMAPTAAWQNYLPASTGGYGDGCTTGGCATGDCGYGYQGCGADNYDCGTYCDSGPRRQWFAGVYGLFMSRDNPGKATSAVLVDGAPAGNYYPQPGTDVFFITSEADADFTGGAEVRFGSTFGSATDPCGCCTYQPFAWELGYWALAEDESFAEITDTFGGTTRIYGGINYAGLEYDRDGTGTTYGYRPVNDYYDYQVPIDSTSTNNVRVLAVRTTQSFQVQNLELNFWRFGAPACGTNSGAYAGSGFGSGMIGNGMLRRAINRGQAACGQASCGQGSCGYDSCGCGSYDACGGDPCGCASPAPRKRFFINGLAGVRYLKMDESFRNAVFFTLDDGSGGVVAGEPGTYGGSMPEDDNVLFHDVEVDNDLLGFQLGCSMNYLVGCRWTLFCDTNFGIYGNQIDAYQRVFSPGGGTVRFVGTGEDAAIRSSKEDVAFLGEARCGIGYQLTKRCRLTSAYRVLAISGVALAPSQVATPVNEDVWRHIDSNDSIVIHGFQGGVEFKY